MIMKREGRKFDHRTLEAIGLMAVERVRDGEAPSAVIVSYGLCRTTIYKWLAAASKPGVGLKALRSRPATGRPRRLTSRQEQQVFRWINGKDPRQYGLDFGLWTRSIVADLIERLVEPCTTALEDAGLGRDEIDEVILVGGMTRMPRVQAAVEDLFGRPPSKGVHPDEVVALGAALQGAALADEIGGVTLRDVTAHSLGIATAGDRYDVIIPLNTQVPCRVPSYFTTNRDQQRRIKIVVLQGESGRASDNDLLQDFALTGIRPATAGDVEVEVAFEIDADGIFVRE